jgi:hypothetical protein
MLVALFALLLLSVVGLGMMYSTNLETAINSNYRDKQTALYAAMAGLQEARDRLRPYDPSQPIPAGRIVPPSALPSLTAGTVIYIINPRSGETVAPWVVSTPATPNPYMDTELCQERILGLSGTLGVPCTTLPSGSSWYTVYNDSLSSADFWHSTNPLDFKWVRIALKANNSTPVAANGDSADSRQVCWDGTRQIVLPVGYGPECVRYGSVIGITVTNPGTGYTSAPTVTIDPPPSGGVQATATANMTLTTSVVGAINVTSQGDNYATVPTVVIDAPPLGGTQATAHVCTSSAECANPYIPPGASVASVSVSSAGTTCYASAPAVLFSGGGGSGAAATAALAGGSTSCIVAWSVTGTCHAHRNETITGIGLTGGGGSGFSGTLKFDSSGNVVTGYPTVQSSGTGYSSNPTAMTGISGCGSLTLSVVRGRRIASPQTITPSSGGSGYTSAPSVSFATGSGSGDSLPAGSATLGPEPPGSRKVRQIIVDNGGSGYTSTPNVTIIGSGTGASASAVLANNVYKVSSITVTNQGYGYTTDPNVTISGGGGSGATATAILGRGANYGKIYLITALGQTQTGGRSMLQMEATTALSGFHSTAALTIDGPDPNVQHMPNSTNFYVNGNDANSCGQTPEPVRPAVGGYDDPNADPPTHSVDEIIDALPDDRLDHYVGDGGTPSVANVYESLGETLGTPLGLKSVLDAVNHRRTNVGNNIDFGSPSVWAYNYIDGDATINGGTDGYGVLAVTGRLTMNGNFTWHGVVLVIGDGILDFGGGGNGTIIGTVLAAKIYPDPGHHTDADLLETLGSPTINWNGGGGNSILYDHCWSTNVMSRVPIDSPVSLRPLKVLSFRSLPY